MQALLQDALDIADVHCKLFGYWMQSTHSAKIFVHRSMQMASIRKFFLHLDASYASEMSRHLGHNLAR